MSLGTTVEPTRNPAAPALDLTNLTHPDIRVILDWPDSFVQPLKQRLLALHHRTPSAGNNLPELAAHHLWDESRQQPTPLGERLIDLIVHEHWQEGDELGTFLQMGSDRLAGTILEIGSSTAWAIRALNFPPTATRIGIDVDQHAIALGYRLAQQEHQPIRLQCCSAHALPFPDCSIDWIICRNAITYMHQRTVIREMGRVLKPGGYAFIRFANVFYDLSNLFSYRSLKTTLGAWRDFTYGTVHALTGCQPVPGSLLRGARAFGTLRRLTQMLRAIHCQILHVTPSLCCPRFLSHPTQTSLLARKSQP
ncbi:MAG: class I SAM-dependent methyltransferase [Bacillota bacterium]